MSLLRKHFNQKIASHAATVTAEQPAKINNVYELQLGQLAQHKRQLKMIQSQELKITAKTEVLEQYDDYIDGVLSADVGGQDDVLTTLMLWHIDCRSFERALDIATYVIEHKLAMPSNMKRTAAATIAEEMADAYIKNVEPAPSAMQLKDVLEIAHEHDMHDQIRAKLHKAIGFALIDEKEDDQPVPDAIPHLERALALNARCGVKTQLEKLLKLQEK